MNKKIIFKSLLILFVVIIFSSLSINYVKAEEYDFLTKLYYSYDVLIPERQAEYCNWETIEPEWDRLIEKINYCETYFDMYSNDDKISSKLKDAYYDRYKNGYNNYKVNPYFRAYHDEKDYYELLDMYDFCGLSEVYKISRRCEGANYGLLFLYVDRFFYLEKYKDYNYRLTNFGYSGVKVKLYAKLYSVYATDNINIHEKIELASEGEVKDQRFGYLLPYFSYGVLNDEQQNSLCTQLEYDKIVIDKSLSSRKFLEFARNCEGTWIGGRALLKYREVYYSKDIYSKDRIYSTESLLREGRYSDSYFFLKIMPVYANYYDLWEAMYTINLEAHYYLGRHDCFELFFKTKPPSQSMKNYIYLSSLWEKCEDLVFDLQKNALAQGMTKQQFIDKTYIKADLVMDVNRRSIVVFGDGFDNKEELEQYNKEVIKKVQNNMNKKEVFSNSSYFEKTNFIIIDDSISSGKCADFDNKCTCDLAYFEKIASKFGAKYLVYTKQSCDLTPVRVNKGFVISTLDDKYYINTNKNMDDISYNFVLYSGLMFGLRPEWTMPYVQNFGTNFGTGKPNCALDFYDAKKLWGDLLNSDINNGYDSKYFVSYYAGCGGNIKYVRPTKTSIMKLDNSIPFTYGPVNNRHMVLRIGGN